MMTREQLLRIRATLSAAIARTSESIDTGERFIRPPHLMEAALLLQVASGLIEEDLVQQHGWTNSPNDVPDMESARAWVEQQLIG